MSNFCLRKTFLKPFGNVSIDAEMKRSRRVDGPSIFCFSLVPSLRNSTNSGTQRHLRKIKPWRWFCTQNPSISQPKMSLRLCSSIITVLPRSRNSELAPNMRLLAISCNNFSYVHIKLWDKHDSRKLETFDFKNPEKKIAQTWQIRHREKQAKTWVCIDFHQFSLVLFVFA